jgi:hypothetical protein
VGTSDRQVGSEWRGGRHERHRAGLLLTLALALGTLGAAGCAQSAEPAEEPAAGVEQGAVQIDPEAVASQPVLFHVGRSVYANGVNGEPSTLLFTAEFDFAGVFRLSPDGGTVYYVTGGPRGAKLWAADLQGGAQEVVAEGVIDIVRVADNGQVIALSEATDTPLDLQRVDTATGDVRTMASGVGQAVASEDGGVFGYLSSADEVDPLSSGAVFLGRTGSEPVLVRDIADTEGARILGITPERFLFMVSPDGDPYMGEIFECDIAAGALASVAKEVDYLAGSADLGRVLVQMNPEPGDPTISQVVLMVRSESGAWDMQAVGEAAAGTVFAARLSENAARATVLAATLGREDALRVFDLASGAVSYETTLPAGTAVASFMASPDAQCLLYLTQRSPEGTEEGIAEEVLLSADVDSDTKTLVTSDQGSGGEIVRPIVAGGFGSDSGS